MIYTDRTITVRKGESKIDEPIVVYRGDYELEVRFTITNSRFKFMSGTNLIETEKASFGQMAILTPYGGNIFSDIVRCSDGTVTFVLTESMINQIEEVGLYSFQIRLYDYNKESRVSIPPIEFGIEVREPIASEDHDNSVNNAIVGYSIAKVVNPSEEKVEDAFDGDGNYNKTVWETGDRISEGKLNKIEDAINRINQNEKNNTASLSKRIDNNYNVLNVSKASNLQNQMINFWEGKIGDSLGDGLTGQGFFQKYTSMYFNLNEFSNHGVGGSRLSGPDASSSQKSMWQDERINALRDDADFITILGGQNDGSVEIGDISKTNMDTNTYVGAYNVIIQKIYMKYNGRIQIILCTPFYVPSDGDDSERFAKLSKAVKEIGQLYGLPVADFGGMSGANKYVKDIYWTSSDYTHPTESFYKDRITPILVETMLKVNPIDFDEVNAIDYQIYQ